VTAVLRSPDRNPPWRKKIMEIENAEAKSYYDYGARTSRK